MGSFSLWHLIILMTYLLIYVPLLIIFVVSAVRILRRTGFSGLWVIIAFVPIANVIALWQFSKARWRISDPLG